MKVANLSDILLHRTARHAKAKLEARMLCAEMNNDEHTSRYLFNIVLLLPLPNFVRCHYPICSRRMCKSIS